MSFLFLSGRSLLIRDRELVFFYAGSFRHFGVSFDLSDVEW